MTDAAEGLIDAEARAAVRNMGGIDECTVRFEPGVTILTGPNATNRTSLLSALGSALGGTTGTLKSDTDGGEISLSLDGDSYVRRYRATGTSVEVSGTPYTDESRTVDLFAALLGDNPVRRAVENEDDLRELVMAPVDTDAIAERVDALKRELDELEDETDRIERERSRLPGLKDDEEGLEERIAELDDELHGLREEAAQFEADIDDTGDAQELVDELESLRATRVELESEIEVQRAELAALRDEQTEIEEKVSEAAEYEESDLERLTEKLSTLRERKSTLRETITALTTVVDFNREALEDDFPITNIDSRDGNVTDGLLPESEHEIRCWTCGAHTKREEIEERLEDIQSLIPEKRDAFKDVEAEIDELIARRNTVEEALERRERLERRRTEIEASIEGRESAIADLDAELDATDEDIAAIESQVADHQDVQESRLIEKYDRIGQLEYERGQLEQRRSDIEAEIEDIESLPDRDTLADQRADLRAELANERNRIETVERDVVEAFNTHMDTLLDELSYDNVARVWIERRQGSERADTEFALHVVRESRDGKGYDDELAHLSESERSVVGLVVALAGYLAHEVHETVPFMLLDSLEAIDAERIDTLVEYFSAYTSYLVVALLPEDAEGVAAEHHRIPADRIGS